MQTIREIVNAGRADFYLVDLPEGVARFDSEQWVEAARFAEGNSAEVIVVYGPKVSERCYVGEYSSNIITHRPEFSDYALAMGFDN